MTEEPAYSIGELAQRAGVTPRTIRYYTAEGLLPSPETRGRYASYTDAHLQRLALIAELKAQYLPLHVIRERLDAESAPPAPRDTRSPFALGPRAAGRSNTAGGPELRAVAGLGGEEYPLQLGRYQFFPYTPDPAQDTAQEPLAPAEHWQRVVITPGVELHVREPLSAARRERLAALIAAARDQLAGDDAAE